MTPENYNRGVISALYRDRRSGPGKPAPIRPPLLPVRWPFLVVLGLLAGYFYWPRTVDVETGIPERLGFAYHPELSVYREPMQLLFDVPPPAERYKDYTIYPVAAFQMQGRLLHKKTYRFDRMARFSPIDLMMSWGLLAEDTWGEDVRFRQARRWGMYRVRGPRAGVWARNPGAHWSNFHLLPASAAVHRAMRSAPVGGLIRMKGFLVNVARERYYWHSSLSRTDEGDTSCEIVLVDSFETL